MNFNIHANGLLRYQNFARYLGKSRFKIFLAMKLTTVLIFLCCFHVSANVFSQEINLTEKNAPLEKVMQKIRKQTGYAFIFDVAYLKKAVPVNADLKGKSLEESLKVIFRDQPFDYQIRGKTIVLSPKAVAPVKGAGELRIEVRGKVVDEKGNPLVGASVAVKGTSQGTRTDGKGEFHLSNVDEKAVLLVSFLGYEVKEIRPAKDLGTISLAILNSQLDQIQVIAYGTTTRRLNTGSISSVKASDIEKQPVSNPLATLEGMVPGMFVTQNNGLPGSNFSVQIRGRNSIQQGSNPLYLVDGVPYGADNLAQNSLISANSPFNNLNPGDIESIEVLKDADATAIYGSRGANGVVLITTKKAKDGKMSLDANMYQGFGRVTRTPDQMDTEQYIVMRREAFKNNKVEPTQQNAYDLLAWNTDRYTDWKQFLIGNTARATNAQLRLNAGGEFTKISLGTNYYRESTVYPGDHASSRISADFKGSHSSSDRRFNLNVSINYGSEKSNLMRRSLTTYINLPPNAPPLYDENGKLNWTENGFSFSNPLAALLEGYNALTDRLTTQSDVSYSILPGLVIKTSLGYNFMRYEEKSLLPIAAQDPFNNPTGSSSIGTNMSKTLIAEPRIEYTSNFSKSHQIKVLIGGTWQTVKNNSILTRASGYTNDDFLNYISASSAPVVTTTNGLNEYKYQAVFARLNYSYNDKYLVNLTGRRDGSSRFGAERQFANFGAIGAAWLFSEEHLVKNNLSFLSYGKLRGSYGITGNDQIGNYQYLDSWSPTDRPYLNNLSLAPARLPNPYYSWEGNKKFDIAFELGLFNDRLLITANWYRNVSSNQLINYSLPTQTGFYNILQNFPGKVENKGWEFQVSSANIKGEKFGWSSSINLTIAKNKLLEFPGLELSSYANSYFIGQPLTIRNGLNYLGVDPDSGIYRFEDKNSDGQYDSRDYSLMDSTDPKFYGGFQNTFTFKGFQIDFLFQFTKQKGIHPIYGVGLPPGSIGNFATLVLDRWQKPGDETKYQQFTQQFGGEAANASFLMSNSNRMLTDASFIRLRNASLSYNFSGSLLSKLKLQKVRFFVQGQNLLTITRFPGDPETQNQLSLPPLKMISTGFQIIF